MPKVQSLSAAVSAGSVVQRHRSWQRILVSADVWRIASEFLSQPLCTLAAFWGDVGSVHMAILDEFSYNLKILTVGCPDHHFPVDRKGSCTRNPPGARDLG